MPSFSANLTRHRSERGIIPVPIIISQGNNRDIGKMVKPIPDFIGHLLLEARVYRDVCVLL